MNTKTSETLKQLSKKVKFSFDYGASLPYSERDEWQKQANDYRCKLRYKGRQYSFDFWQGVAINHDPDAAGCLDCLLSDASSGDMAFEDFCSEMGYDADSRKAERIWKACQSVTKHIKRLLGGDYETFLYSERD